MDERENSFTSGKLLAPLLRFTLPVLLAIFLQAMYGAVDLLIVGRFGDASGVSAVSTGSQMMQAVTGIVTGLTMGATILLGQRIGQKDDKAAADAVGTSVVFFGILGVVLSLLVVLVARPCAILMQAPAEALEKTVQYLMICGAGTICIMAYNVISGIFRGMGNSRAPLLFVCIACVANIAGDLLFVGVFKMDAAGAALATVLAQALSVACSLLLVKKQGFPFAFSRRNIHLNKATAGNILRFGTPVALQDLMTSLSFLIIIAILNHLGLVASAGAGIAEKVCTFIMLIPISFMSSISAFVAQNVGAGEHLRARKAMLYGMAVSEVAGIIMFVFAFWNGSLLTGLFSNEAAVVAAGADYLKAYALDCLLVPVLFCAMGYCNGYGKTLFVMLQSLLSAFLVRIPVALFMSRLPETSMFKVGLASPIASVFGLAITVVYLANAKWAKMGAKKKENIPA